MRTLRRLAALLPLLTAPLAAQEPTGPVRLRGLTVDHWDGAGGPALLRPTLRATSLIRGRLGPDLALTFFPDAVSLFPPAAVVGLQAALAYPIDVGPVSMLPKAGAAGILLAQMGGERPLYLIPGVQCGLGLLFRLDAKSLFRADLTRHLYLPEGRNVGFWSVGFGFAVPRREKH